MASRISWWLVAVMTLSGCSAFSGPVPQRDEITARIRLVSDAELPAGVYGDSRCAAGFCDIRIRRSTYPLCIQHEIRHGFEPRFHAGRKSTEDCNAN